MEIPFNEWKWNQNTKKNCSFFSIPIIIVFPALVFNLFFQFLSGIDVVCVYSHFFPRQCIVFMNFNSPHYNTFVFTILCIVVVVPHNVHIAHRLSFLFALIHSTAFSPVQQENIIHSTHITISFLKFQLDFFSLPFVQHFRLFSRLFRLLLLVSPFLPFKHKHLNNGREKEERNFNF